MKRLSTVGRLGFHSQAVTIYRIQTRSGTPMCSGVNEPGIDSDRLRPFSVGD